MKVTNDIYYVGVNDHKIDLFEGQYKVPNGMAYNSYIILDDELDIRAYEVLKELKKESKFKIPVIIMIDKDVEFIKDHFVDDGFSDYIIKSDLKNELDRIFK